MKIYLVIAFLLLLMPIAALAGAPQVDQSPATGATSGASPPVQSTESNWRLGVALGYGVRTNPLLQSDDIPIVVDVDIAWFGNHFFFDNGDFGLTFLDNESVTASIVARVNSDRVFFGRTNTKFVTVGLAGEPLVEAAELKIPDRDYAAEMGIEILADGRWGQLQVSAHHDVGGTHDGYEIDFDYGIGFRNQRFYFEPSFGATYKSAAMNDYYWGIRPGEAGDALPSYIANSGVNAHARLMFSYQMNENWAFTLVSEFERLNSEAAASPIVAEQNVIGYFVGFGYRF